MISFELITEDKVPQFACSECCKCNSKFGKSLCEYKNRGCCWYFPKFNLYDIQKMVKDKEGKKILDNIMKLPGVKIYNYYIHVKGFFDEKGYNEYLNSYEAYEDEMNDKSIYFRACPFVRDGEGCSLPAKYRSYVCNFYICDEVIDKIGEDKSYKEYIKERDSYVKWLEWENEGLEAILKEKGINLINNFNKVIEVLEEIEEEDYEFVNLSKIEI